jgi:hypothetical protein
MTTPFQEFSHWVGSWIGRGELRPGLPIVVRIELFAAQQGCGLGIHFEALDEKLQEMIHGGRAILSAAPSGVQRAVTWSSVFGPMLMERTPDDEDVLALLGRSETGVEVSMTMVEEGEDEILFTSYSRPLLSEDTPSPRMTVTLKRMHAFKPPE